MLEWLDSGKTMYNKLKIRFYSDYNRGVCTRQKIHNKEQILIVPQSHLITLEMAKETPISKKIIEHGLDLLSPNLQTLFPESPKIGYPTKNAKKDQT